MSVGYLAGLWQLCDSDECVAGDVEEEERPHAIAHHQAQAVVALPRDHRQTRLVSQG